MKIRYPLLAVAITAAVLALPAQASDDLAKKYQCMACHQIDKKMVGPAYKDVAKKYKGQSDAAAKLATHVKKGSAGIWGPVPMPPNEKVPDADVKTLVDWILKQG